MLPWSSLTFPPFSSRSPSPFPPLKSIWSSFMVLSFYCQLREGSSIMGVSFNRASQIWFFFFGFYLLAKEEESHIEE